MKIVTAGTIHSDSGEILILRRGPQESLSGFWEFAGGKVENGESEQACLKRELKEELGIEVSVGEFIEESHYIYEHGEFILRAYEAIITGGKIELSVHDDSAWVDPEKLQDYKLAPADIPIAKKLALKQ